MLTAILIVFGSVVLDQAVKFWAVNTLKDVGTIPFIKGFLDFSYAENTGAALSLFEGGRWVFVILTCLVLIAAVIAIKKGIVHTQFGKISLYLVMGGALGNLIDRLLNGFVVDMFDFQLFGRRLFVFNVADIFVTVGGVLFIIYLFFFHDLKEEQSTETKDENQ